MKIIGIAGGSGSGKSTVAYALADSDPEKYVVLNFDDYQKLPTDKADVKKLSGGHSLTLDTKDFRHNPDYKKAGKRLERTIQPKPVLIVEGYLALYNPELNKLYDKTLYLDLDEAARQSRRDKNVGYDGDKYSRQVLKPMHDKFVEPTKAKADVVIDVSRMNTEEIAESIKDLI